MTLLAFFRGMPSIIIRIMFSACLFYSLGSYAADSTELSNARAQEIRIHVTPFEPRSSMGALPFTRYDGSLFGLNKKNDFSPRDFYPPFFNGGGISSGDINRDGWPDIVSAAGAKIIIYINRKGQEFTAREIDLGGLEGSAIFNVALVDINGDGWLDLFATTYLQGNFYLLNKDGEFTTDGLRQPPRGKAVLSAAVSFGDVDRDGDLDVVVGNWFAGASKQHPPPHSKNELWINEGEKFQVSQMSGLVGETLSMLLSDWTGDGWLDLIVGNDFAAPDIYYRGDGKGGFKEIKRQDGIIPHSTESTMSIDSADFDNDLDLDVFIDQITARATGPSAHVRAMPLENYCDDIHESLVRERCLANMDTRLSFFYGANHQPSNVRRCKKTPDKRDQQACIGMQVMMTAQRFRKPKLCDAIPEQEVRTRALCRNFFEKVIPHDRKRLAQSIPQQMNQNVLLVREPNGKFNDEAEALGLGFTGWSWNARFADVDNDEWQDMFIVSGSWFRATPSGTTANFFFRNEAGKKFKDQTDAFGLQNFMIVSAYTVTDFDRDGDLDFITNSVNGPLWLLRNNAQTGNSIVYQLKDEVGNRDGIGTKLTIHYGPKGARHQLREIKASGGYLSFDEPRAHFGLGDYDQVERLEIRWSTGGTTVIPGPFDAGHVYTVDRSWAKVPP